MYYGVAAIGLDRVRAAPYGWGGGAGPSNKEIIGRVKENTGLHSENMVRDSENMGPDKEDMDRDKESRDTENVGRDEQELEAGEEEEEEEEDEDREEGKEEEAAADGGKGVGWGGVILKPAHYSGHGGAGEDVEGVGGELAEEGDCVTREGFAGGGMFWREADGVRGGEWEEVAIKIFKTSIMVFRDRDRYVTGDWRFKQGYSKSPRKMAAMWAEKEFRNLNRCVCVRILNRCM